MSIMAGRIGVSPLKVAPMPPSPVPPVSESARVLGERVRARREELGLSLEELGGAAGVHWSMCGLIERGQRNASLHVLLRLAAGLGTDLAELVKSLPPPPPPNRRKRPKGGAQPEATGESAH